MINQKSIRAVRSARFREGRFVKPLYDSYGFTNILPWVEALCVGGSAGLPSDIFGDKHRYRNVVLFLVDGFGWQIFKKVLKRSAPLRRIADRGMVSQFTAQFPSATAAAVTSLHTGSTVGGHGIYEWFYYEPKIDAVIAPIIFSVAGDKTRNTLLEAGVNAQAIFPKTTFYEHLQGKGATAAFFVPQEYLPSPYSEALTRGASVVPYKTVADGFVELSGYLSRRIAATYTLFYFGKFDSMSHKYGSTSSEAEAEIDAFFAHFEQAFSLAQEDGEALFLISADHGQIDIDPAKTIYLNEMIPSLTAALKKTKNGKPIAPMGGGNGIHSLRSRKNRSRNCTLSLPYAFGT